MMLVSLCLCLCVCLCGSVEFHTSSEQKSEAKCGDDGICNCEDGFCTLETDCTCPEGYTKHTLPNSGTTSDTQESCFACRPAVKNPVFDDDDGDDDVFSSSSAPSSSQFDDDEGEGDIFGNDDDNADFDEDEEDIFGGSDDDDDDDDDFDGSNDNEQQKSQNVLSRENAVCGMNGVCDCDDNRCSVESDCLCPLGYLKLELPNTGFVGDDVCYACRTEEQAAAVKMNNQQEQHLEVPIYIGLPLMLAALYAVYVVLSKLKESQAPPLTRKERQRQHKLNKKNKSKKK